jgi:hypothetical protein
MVIAVQTARMPKGRDAWFGLMWLGLIALILLSGLCTAFALVVTAVQARQESQQAQWPEAPANVDISRMEQRSIRRRQIFHLHCQLSYEVGAERHLMNLYSRFVPGPNVPQYPAGQIEPLEEWVRVHPPGTPMRVRYDPSDHAKAVLAADYLPYGGPQTAKNVRLVEACAGSFFALLLIARLVRPREPR